MTPTDAANPARVFAPPVKAHLDRLYAPHHRQFDSTGIATAADLAVWQARARPALAELLGLPRIAREAGGFEPQFAWDGPEEELGRCTRRRATFTPEPGVAIPVFVLRPKGTGPFPLSLHPHGHSEFGLYAGVVLRESDRPLLEVQVDIAVQAASRGFYALAPATRGIAPGWVDDVTGRWKRHCRAAAQHSLLAGRTAIGERVWDMMRLLDWASRQSDIDASAPVMIGNSGGGQCTTYTAALDPRIALAVPNCSFAPLLSIHQTVLHCDCNLVPGITRFGEYWDVAALIAPRPLCFTHGRQDSLFPEAEVYRAVTPVRELYERLGAVSRFAHCWGDGGHRFYADPIWEFVDRLRGGAPRPG